MLKKIFFFVFIDNDRSQENLSVSYGYAMIYHWAQIKFLLIKHDFVEWKINGSRRDIVCINPKIQGVMGSTCLGNIF